MTSSKAVEFGTIYDIQKYEGAAKTYRRAVEAYDLVVQHVERSIVDSWRRQRGETNVGLSASDA